MTRDDFRIGLIADTHEADEPIRLTDELAKLDCDLHVHLGDVGGSRVITAAIRQFKQYPESGESLPPDRRRLFDAALAQGLPPLRAYLSAVLSDEPADRHARMAETAGNYRGIADRLAGLPDALCLSGNTDRGLMSRNLDLVAPFTETGLPFLTWPAGRDFDGRLIVFWPSLGRDQVADPRLDALVDTFIQSAQRARAVAIIAHEQLFKGPRPEVYRRNSLARGFRPLTVPNYEPSLSWRHLTRLIRGLPEKVPLAYLHGHVHDANQVLGAGAPYLRPGPHGALLYRVWSGPEGSGRRIASYSVPIEQLARLTFTSDSFLFEAWRPELAATRERSPNPSPASV